MIAIDLLAAVVRGDEAEWPSHATRQDEEAFIEAATDHSLEPIVTWTLRNAGTFDSWPDALQHTLSEKAREEAVLEASRQGELRTVLDTLAAAAVPSLLIKGAALAYTHYPRPWFRPRRDNDLLIRRCDLAAVDRILNDAGYERANTLEGEVVGYQQPYAKTDRIGGRHVIDVHWKVTNRPVVADQFSFEELSAEAVCVPALGPAAFAPGAVHQLLLACIHPVMHHRNWDNLVWKYDIHLLARGLGEAGLERLAALARAKGVAAICADGLSGAAARFRTAVPKRIFDALAVSGEPSEAFLGPDPWRGDVRLADFRALNGWRAKLQLVREVALPGAGYMLREYGYTNRALVPALHARRIVRGSWRLLRRFA